jgi:hypothetical protein
LIDLVPQRLMAAVPSATWRIPDGAGGTYQLLPNEGLFVHTPHEAVVQHFAVVRTANPVLGPTNATGPVAQQVGGVRPHVQATGVDAGHPWTCYALWIDGRDDDQGLPGGPVLGNASFHGVPQLFGVFEPEPGYGTPPPSSVAPYRRNS